MADGTDIGVLPTAAQAPPQFQPPPPPPSGAGAAPSGGPPPPPSAAPFPGAVAKPRVGTRVAAGVGGFLAGFGHSGDAFMRTPLGQRIMAYQKSRLDETAFRSSNMQQLEGKIALAQQGIDPDTGQKLSPEDQQRKIEELTNQHNAEEAAFQKLAGVTPEVKKHLAQAKQLKDSLRQRMSQGGGQGGQGGAQGGAGASQPPGKAGGPPAPPAGQGEAAGAGATPSAAPQGPPRPPSTGLAPPVDPKSLPGMAAGGRLATQQADADMQQRRQAVMSNGGDPRDPQNFEYILTGKFPTSVAPKSVAKQVTGADLAKNYPNVKTPTGEAPDAQSYYDLMANPDGSLYASPSGATAGMRQPKKTDVAEQNGKPFGIKRYNADTGKIDILKPSDEDFTAADKKTLDAALQAYKDVLADKAKMATDNYERYARMRGQVYLHDVRDLKTGKLITINANQFNELNKEPGRYVSANPAQKQSDRQSIFSSIDTSVDFTNSAIAQMPESEWDATSSAKLSAAMKSADPTSALSLFINSAAMKELDPAQQNYVLALKDLSESAMALRGLGGFGGATDKLRDAITGMIPGPGTPSKTYAENQMKRLNAEVAALRSSIPTNIPQGSAAPPQPPGGPPVDAAGYLKYLQQKKAAAAAAPAQ